MRFTPALILVTTRSTTLAALSTLALVLLAACGGSSSSSSPPTSTAGATATSSPSPTPPPAGSICRGTDLYGAFVSSQGAAGTIYYEIGVTNIGALDCILVNPPVLHFKDASGADLGVTAASGIDCPAGGPYDPATCLDQDAVDLPVGAATPAAGAAPGQLTVTLAVTNSGRFCPSMPAVLAHTITLRFTGTTEDVRIELPSDIDLDSCHVDAQLNGYGPSK